MSPSRLSDPMVTDVLVSTKPSPEQDSERGHIVRFYENDAFLTRSVTEFLSPALSADVPGIVVATPEHRAIFAQGLVEAGFDVVALAESGQLKWLDARETLEMFMVGDRPDPARFDDAVGNIVREASRGGRTPRIYGEMVALLRDDGNAEGAMKLEDLWNDLSSQPFLLLCAYRLEGPPGEGPDVILNICERHSLVLPRENNLAWFESDEVDIGEPITLVKRTPQENPAPLASVITHDLLNSLLVILNYSTFVAESLDEAEQSDLVQAARKDVVQILNATKAATSLTQRLEKLALENEAS